METSGQGRVQLLGTKSVTSLLWEIAIPSMIGMVAASVYSIVDTIYIGNVEGMGDIYLSAMAVFFPIEESIIVGLPLLLGTGIAPLISVSLGKKDTAATRKQISTFFYFGIALSAAVIVSTYSLLSPILDLAGATDLDRDYAYAYGKIIVLYATYGYFFSVGSGPLLRVENRATFSMNRMIVSSAINIMVDPLLIYVFEMGLEGAAWSTVTSVNVVGLYMVYYFFYDKKTTLLVANVKEFAREIRRNAREILDIATKMIMIGLGIYLIKILLSISNIVLNRLIVELSETPEEKIAYKAIYSVASRMSGFVYMPSIGLAQSFIPIFGYSIGIKNYTRAKEVMRTTFKILVLFVVLLSGTMIIFSRQIFDSFVSSDSNLDSELGAKILTLFLSGTSVYMPSLLTMMTFQVRKSIKGTLFMGSFKPLLLILTFNVFAKLTGDPESLAYGALVSDLTAGTVAWILLYIQYRQLTVCEEKESDKEESSLDMMDFPDTSGDRERE